jgi:ubiquinone/menaquinone biosynthesis C-methylase UbiE
MSHNSSSATPNLEKVILTEADAWYRRNRQGQLTFEPSPNFVRLTSEIERLGFTPKSFLEVGASDGYNLLAFEKCYPGTFPIVGVEASAMAVSHGQKELSLRKSSAKLIEGSGHRLFFPGESFDLVYLGFVLYLADDTLLSEFYDEAIRVLKPGGLLCVTDFFPTGSTPAYAHDPEIKIEKRDHVKLLQQSGQEYLSPIYFQVSSSSGTDQKAWNSRNILDNLDDFEFNAIFIKHT